MTTQIDLIEQAADIIEQAPRLAKGWFRIPLDWMDENGREIKQNLQNLTIDERDAAIERARQDGTLCFCLYGGAYEANRRLGLHVTEKYETELAVDYILDLYVPEGFFSFSHWNDAPERTKEEVVAKLREIAAEERKRLEVQGSDR